jgi:hypothetical protein
LEYLKKSELSGRRLARFHEMKTNKPLYLTKDYRLTYEADDLPTHYGFIWTSRVDAIEAEYKRLTAADPAKVSIDKLAAAKLAAQARAVIDALDARGAWVEKGQLRFHRLAPPSGVIHCRTFTDNVRTLSAFIARE